MKTVNHVGRLGALTALLVVTLPALAGFKDGNELWTDLQAAHRVDERSQSESDFFPASRGVGYIIGVADTLDGQTICIPSNVTVGQVKDIVFGWLRDHPDKRHLSASLLIREVLADTFPCARRK